MLSLLGAVEDEVLFRLCDQIVDADTAGALLFLEELSEQGQDLGRLVVDLLEHLRHLMLVQATGEVPETLPVTEEARERLREQAHQLGAPTVLRLIDLLHVAVDDMRQGGDPRLPLELALVKVTRPGSDLSRESLAYRVEQLERAGGPPGHTAATAASTAAPAPPPAADPAAASSTSEPAPIGEPASAPTAPPVPLADTAAASTPAAAPVDEPAARPPDLKLEELQEAWRRSILPVVDQRSIPAGTMLEEAQPVALAGDTLTLEFPPKAQFQREKAEEPANQAHLQAALYEVTGRHLELLFETGARAEPAKAEPERPATEEEIVELVRSTFDAELDT